MGGGGAGSGLGGQGRCNREAKKFFGGGVRVGGSGRM